MVASPTKREAETKYSSPIYSELSSVGHVLRLVPRFDREFVMTLQRYGYFAAKMTPDMI